MTPSFGVIFWVKERMGFEITFEFGLDVDLDCVGIRHFGTVVESDQGTDVGGVRLQILECHVELSAVHLLCPVPGQFEQLVALYLVASYLQKTQSKSFLT